MAQRTGEHGPLPKGLRSEYTQNCYDPTVKDQKPDLEVQTFRRDIFLKKIRTWPSKQQKRRSSSLAIGEMPIKTTERDHLTPTRPGWRDSETHQGEMGGLTLLGAWGLGGQCGHCGNMESSNN